MAIHFNVVPFFLPEGIVIPAFTLDVTKYFLPIAALHLGTAGLMSQETPFSCSVFRSVCEWEWW